MKRVSIFMNSPYIGGAERSMILQAHELVGYRKFFFIPNLSGQNSDELEKLIQEEHSDAKIYHFNYPNKLYSISRSGKLFGAFKLLLLLFDLIKLLLRLNRLNLSGFDLVWANGNKVAFPLLILMHLSSFKNKFVWHFRDYPENKGVFKYVWRLLSQPSNFKKILLSNSYSVDKRVKEIIGGKGGVEFKVVYNPVDKLKRIPLRGEMKNIGVVAMLAPWKGVHKVISFEKEYRVYLKDIGVEKISIYGGDIYSTGGEHDNYKKELLDNLDEGSIVEFMGNISPQNIYQNLDLLIHSSIKAEPFGRVIVEGLTSGVPVISSCLGGSSELIDDGVSGKKFDPFNIESLKEAIDSMNSLSKRERFVENGLVKLSQIEDQQRKFWKEFLST